MIHDGHRTTVREWKTERMRAAQLRHARTGKGTPTGLHLPTRSISAAPPHHDSRKEGIGEVEEDFGPDHRRVIVRHGHDDKVVEDRHEYEQVHEEDEQPSVADPGDLELDGAVPVRRYENLPEDLILVRRSRTRPLMIYSHEKHDLQEQVRGDVGRISGASGMRHWCVHHHAATPTLKSMTRKTIRLPARRNEVVSPKAGCASAGLGSFMIPTT